ncbi:amidase [Vitiosangium sp. GDMCC 1.1324]|uniref:amidase n=1 Tax=Vitiosangium sp. (strain GDMCC 1.1324) TaxID=2138576 RepID=UPI000D333677|nr:amidase [Vitiosangium sp. GDMCC 1.1324]PTL75930.1 amidase [Vitiosangium sp. GDMCC 1.1324]
MAIQGYDDLDATALATLIRKKELHPTELVEEVIARIESVDPMLNAVVHKMYEQARKAAAGPLSDGPFAGVPFLVKDLDGFLAGEPFTGGCRALVGFVPDHDSELMARFRRTGVVFVGKTATPELGILGVTEPALRGPTRNPWNPDHTPGGSSGGSAACVAARVVPMAHGGDGGGSIRIPASACGLFGLKPTRARNPVGPDAGEAWGGFVQAHVLTRTVRDSAAMLDATQGPEVGAPYGVAPPVRPFLQEVGTPPGRLRIAFSTGSLFGKHVHPDCKAAVQDAVKLCQELGHEVVEDAPRFDREELVRAYLVTVAASVAVQLEEIGRQMGKTVSPADVEASTWALAQIGNILSAADLQKARDSIHRSGRLTAAFHERYDVFLDATLAYPPVRVGELALKPAELAALALLRKLPLKPVFIKLLDDLAANSLERTPNTQLFNLSGQPAMSVPLFWNAAGLPIGVQFAARFGEEATLFRLAAQLEQARPWVGRKPQVSGRKP